MKKLLKIAFPERCIKCELCIMETQRQLNKVGLEGALLRIFKTKKETSIAQELDVKSKISFTIELDPRIHELDLQKIKNICPTEVFTIDEVPEKESEDHGLVG